MRRPLWIIGIDGLDPGLLKQWCAAGYLPTFTSLRARGVSGCLLSTPNQMTSSAWTTLATGSNPGAHGIYNFQERVPGEYRLRLPTADDRHLATFWELASGGGLAVITARVPMSYPVRPINGIQVADWLAPSPQAEGFIYPESLRRELLRRFPRNYWLEPVDLSRCTPEKALRGVLTSVDHTFSLFRYLLQRLPADLFFGAVREADLAGHFFWDFHSGAIQVPLEKHREKLARALLTVYQHIDERLAELLALMPQEANCMVVSDHGMGCFPGAPRCVQPLLEATGVMIKTTSIKPTGAPSSLRQRLATILPWELRRRLRPLSPNDWTQGFTREHLSGIDFSRSRAFSFLSLLTGEIWLNIQGRDPEGMVERGESQQQLEDDLIALFSDATDMATGEGFVRAVWRRDELFTGPYCDILADLHVEFDLETQPRAIRSHWQGRSIEIELPETGLKGGLHRPYAAFLACGPDIRQRPKAIAGSLMDVAPTALALLQCEVPEYMEGRVFTEMMVKDDEANGSDKTHIQHSSNHYTPEEMASVEQRLAQLGYL